MYIVAYTDGNGTNKIVYRADSEAEAEQWLIYNQSRFAEELFCELW